MPEPDDFGHLLEELGEYEEPVLPFDWKNLPHEPVGPNGYRSRAAKAAWSLTLTTGRMIRLISIRQIGTLAGVLCGSPRSVPGFNDNGYISERAARHAAEGEDPASGVSVTFDFMPGFGRVVTVRFGGANEGLVVSG